MLVRVQLGEFKRSASNGADRFVYRLTREKPPAGAPWRGVVRFRVSVGLERVRSGRRIGEFELSHMMPEALRCAEEIAKDLRCTLDFAAISHRRPIPRPRLASDPARTG